MAFMKVVMKVISTTLTVLLTVLLLLVIFFVGIAKIKGEEPNIMGYKVLTVLSGSMEPNIKTGSVIAVKPLDNPSSLKVNDVITYKSLDDPNKRITHRIIEIKNKNGQLEFITKGDNNDAADSLPIPATNVEAKYANITIPYVGQAVEFAKTKTGIIWLMIVPGALLLLWQLVNIWRIIANMDDSKQQTKGI
jgi:signal peptidase